MHNFKRSLVALLGLLLLIGGLAAITPFKSYGKQSPDATTTATQNMLVVDPSTNAAQTSSALLVQAEAGQGSAAPGNNLPAKFLVVVTDPVTGEAVTNLTQSTFQIINHFSLPGQTCGFSNNITSFVNVGTGAYRIHVRPGGCNWVAGDYLAQIIVGGSARKGQAAATLSIE